MKPPRLLKDVYRDLRDRRLLPLVALLLVAILAVPVLLKSDVETPPASIPSPDPTAEEVRTLPAVLAANPGLRDYRERLEDLNSKNPFGQKLELTGTSAGTAVDVEDVTGGPAGGVDVTSTDGGSPTGDSASGDTASSTGTGSQASGGVREFLIRHELKVEVDGPRDTRKFEGVRELDTLPGKKTPLLVYVGVTPDENQAVFLLSQDIVKTDGDGDCRPARDDCQILSLGAGHQRTLWYTARGGPAEKYIVKLHDIERVVEPLN